MQSGTWLGAALPLYQKVQQSAFTCLFCTILLQLDPRSTDPDCPTIATTTAASAAQQLSCQAGFTPRLIGVVVNSTLVLPFKLRKTRGGEDNAQREKS